MSYKNSFDDRVISNESFVKIPADQHYQWSPVPFAEVTDGDFTSVPDAEPSDVPPPQDSNS